MLDIPTPAERATSDRRFAGSAAGAAAAWSWREAEHDGSAAGRASLRREGALRAAIGLAVAAALAFWRPGLAGIVAGVSVGVMVLALLSPEAGYARLSGWIERFAHAVGTAVTWLLMPLLFYLLFWPVGRMLRAGHKLRLSRAPDAALPSYWSEPPDGHRWGGGGERYRKQF